MKLPEKLLVTSLLALTMTTTFAASSTDLQVKGKIVPEDCTYRVQTSDGGDQLNFDNLVLPPPNAAGYFVIPAKQVALFVNCSENTQIVLKTTDDNGGNKSTNDRGFSFTGGFSSNLPSSKYYNLTSNGKPVGAYAVWVKNFAAYSGQSRISPDGENWSYVQRAYFSTDNPYINAPIIKSDFLILMDVGISINKLDDLPPENIAFEGGATIEIIRI